jgi:hypothetical protein
MAQFFSSFPLVFVQPFNLIKAQFFPPAIVELCRARAGVVRHLRRFFQRAAILQIGCESL